MFLAYCAENHITQEVILDVVNYTPDAMALWNGKRMQEIYACQWSALGRVIRKNTGIFTAEQAGEAYLVYCQEQRITRNILERELECDIPDFMVRWKKLEWGIPGESREQEKKKGTDLRAGRNRKACREDKGIPAGKPTGSGFSETLPKRISARNPHAVYRRNDRQRQLTVYADLLSVP